MLTRREEVNTDTQGLGHHLGPRCAPLVQTEGPVPTGPFPNAAAADQRNHNARPLRPLQPCTPMLATARQMFELVVVQRPLLEGVNTNLLKLPLP